MIRKYIPIFILSFLASQDIAGTYQFQGLYAIYQNIARYDTPIKVSDIYDMNLVLAIDTINAGEIYRATYQGPYGHLYANALNVVLNVTFNPDGTGEILEGSYYPTETIEDCNAEIAVLPMMN